LLWRRCGLVTVREAHAPRFPNSRDRGCTVRGGPSLAAKCCRRQLFCVLVRGGWLTTSLGMQTGRRCCQRCTWAQSTHDLVWSHERDWSRRAEEANRIRRLPPVSKPARHVPNTRSRDCSCDDYQHIVRLETADRPEDAETGGTYARYLAQIPHTDPVSQNRLSLLRTHRQETPEA
jgi:hypothetical protein